MARRLVAFVVVGLAVALQPEGPTTCTPQEDTCDGPVSLLQSHRSMHKAEVAESLGARVGSGDDEVSSQAAALPTQPSDNDWEAYFKVKAMRTSGYRCPGGDYFPPNAGDFAFDCNLWKAAVLHSEDMGTRAYFNHTDPEGRSPFERTSAHGHITFNEDIAGGTTDAATTVAQWANQDSSCKVMMSPKYTRYAVGYAKVAGSQYAHYWTQLISSNRQQTAADTTCYKPGMSGSGQATAGGTAGQGTGTAGSGTDVSGPVTGGDVAGTGTAVGSQGQSGPSAEELQMYNLVKSLRKSGFTCPGGVKYPPNDGEFLFDCRLWRAARLHSEDMGRRNYMSHTDPDGKTAWDMTAAQGLGTYMEFVSAGLADPAQVLEQLKGASTCQNLMAPTVNRYGAGYARVPGSKYMYYWTHFMGGDRGQADAACYGGSGGGGSAGACSDNSEHCAWWASIGYCDKTNSFYSYMTGNCPKACGFCQ